VALIALLLLVLVTAAVVGVPVGLLLVASTRPDADLSDEVASARRHSLLVSGLATALAVVALVGLLGAVSLAGSSGLQVRRLLGAMPLAAAAVALLVLWVGELTWPRPTGAIRTALLHDRSTATLARGRWPRAAMLVTGLLAGTCLVAGLVADPDGRTLTRRFPGGEISGSPFPGWFYGLPQLVALACCVALTAAVLAAAARRPAVVTADVDTDRLLRRASAARACRVLLCAALVTLAGDLVTAGSRATSVGVAEPGHAVGAVALALGLLALPAAVAVAFLPVPRLARRREPAAA
jgi:hypothetical protein